MLQNLTVKTSIYTKVEIIFFIIYFYAFAVLTDLEYIFLENYCKRLSFEDLESTLAFGTMRLPAFLLFYKGLHYCIRNKQAWRFLVLVALFLVGYSFYQRAVYFAFAQLDFFSDEFRSLALRRYASKALGYSMAYMFRELLVVSALAYFIHYLKQSEKLKTLKEQQLISELTYLKAQLQPHFFFNTMNNIYGLALAGSNDTAPMVAKLSDMMRYILYHSDQQCVPLQQEITFLVNYVDIERIRHHGHVSIDFDIEGEPDGRFIAPLILLPFVENAFKHGVGKTVNATFVEIVLLVNSRELHFQVRNSNPVKKYTDDEKEGGIGLMNVKKRLVLLYPDHHQLEIVEEKTFYQVNLTLLWKV